MTTIELGSKLTFQEINNFVESVTKHSKSDAGPIYIDMKNCQYLNSIMLSGLIRALKLCEQGNCKMILRDVNASAMTLFETTNVLNLFNIENNEPPSPADSRLEIRYKEENGNLGIFELNGSLNNSDQCSEFRENYEQNIINVQYGILDCSNLFHLGSPGVNEMFRLRGILQEKSGKLFMMNPTDSVESVWKMMHLESLIPSIEKIADIHSEA